ncbi:MAG TPA: methylmalonyl-CoA mutase family protein, partial [Tepidiformaceae bacterium]|nr:methylmalonyl-CoA mutase family protein [Tepidiformaceae bacterium]
MPITSKREWLQGPYAKAIERAPERAKVFETTGRMPLEPIYTQDDLRDWDPNTELGLPGDYPFTRGIQPTMYRGRFWTMRQYAGFGTAEESNQRYRYLLAQGQTGLSVAFDLPTQIGYDSDDPMAAGEVGKVGVAIDSIDDMLTLFDQIPLDKVTTSMTITATASILLALYVAVGKKQGVSPDKLGGTVQNDILKEYIARGTYIYPPKPSMRLITDIFAYCKDVVPQWNTISISGYHMREAGCTAAQEIAFTLADGIAYVDAAISAGLDVDEFAGRLSFFFACHNNFLEEIAKFRAARRLWARIMKERFNAKSSRSQMLRFHTQTGGATLTAQQPENNIVRTTVQALAAVLGGTQSLHTNSMDEALALPTEKAVQIALRTQQILAYENGVGDVVDPLGGSYFVEDMTNRLEAEANEYITAIDNMGGSLVAIEKGFQQKEIQEAAYRFQMQVESKERVIVGVNDFVNSREDEPELLRVDPALGQRQAQRLRALRASRDGTAVDALLAKL